MLHSLSPSLVFVGENKESKKKGENIEKVETLLGTLLSTSLGKDY